MRLAIPVLVVLCAACSGVTDLPPDSDDDGDDGGGGVPVPYSEPVSYVPVTAYRPCIGKPYARQLSAQGGTAPYTWSIAAGTPPAWITLSPRGLLTGTPTDSTAANFTVRVTDALGASATGTPAISPVAGCSNPFFLGPITLSLVGQGGDTGYQPFVQGGTPPYTFTATGLPPGLSIDAATGAITGRATTAGGFDVILRICDSTGACLEGAARILSIAPSVPRTGGKKYDGTWLGQFSEQYELCPKPYGRSAVDGVCSYLDENAQKHTTAMTKGSYTFNVTLKLEQAAPTTSGVAVMNVTGMQVSDPRLGCGASGCVLTQGLVLFNDPPRNLSTDGVGVALITSNFILATENTAGAAHMNSLGLTLSNSLDPAHRTDNWILGFHDDPTRQLEDLVVPGWKDAPYAKVTSRSWVLACCGVS